MVGPVGPARRLPWCRPIDEDDQLDVLDPTARRAPLRLRDRLRRRARALEPFLETPRASGGFFLVRVDRVSVLVLTADGDKGVRLGPEGRHHVGIELRA